MKKKLTFVYEPIPGGMHHRVVVKSGGVYLIYESANTKRRKTVTIDQAAIVSFRVTGGSGAKFKVYVEEGGKKLPNSMQTVKIPASGIAKGTYVF